MKAVFSEYTLLHGRPTRSSETLAAVKASSGARRWTCPPLWRLADSDH